MRRVYLDQNKWIEPARAAAGKDGGELDDLLVLARHARRRRPLSFPLSSFDYVSAYDRHMDGLEAEFRRIKRGHRATILRVTARSALPPSVRRCSRTCEPETTRHGEYASLRYGPGQMGCSTG